MSAVSAATPIIARGAISAILTEEGNTGSFVIKSIKRTRKGISSWRKAGIAENIREF